MRIQIWHGDCLKRMGEMAEESVPTLITDPPYGLEFQNQDWDRLDWADGGGMAKAGIGERNIPWPSYSGTGAAGTANATCASCGGRMRGANTCDCEEPDWRVKGEPVDPKGNAKRMRAQQAWHVAWLREAFRVLAPGGVVKAFSGTRTFHRLAAAMEDAGLVGIHLEAWAYSSGFPKSHNVAVYLDRMLTEGRSRKVVRHGIGNLNGRFADAGEGFVSQSKAHKIVTEEGRQWDGWGTALKPAWEPVLVGRKPG